MPEDVAIDTGMEMHDLFESPEFQNRGKLHHDQAREVRVLRRMTNVIAERPADALQELVDIAVEECHADSSGVSLEELQAETGPRFRWVVVAGSFSRYLNGTTPEDIAPCGTCLDRGVLSLTKSILRFSGRHRRSDPRWHSDPMAQRRNRGHHMAGLPPFAQ